MQEGRKNSRKGARADKQLCLGTEKSSQTNELIKYRLN